ncbi:response regulator [Candidatus Kaiserbacteria bacterium]|nr:response regulator [Candidatus Kaiserbacteria bacterium]
MTSLKKTILIAEDDALLRNALVDKLAREGFNALEARTGAQCLRLAFQHHPELIILDIMMPGLDGREVLKKLRIDPWGAHARILVLTNLGSGEIGIDVNDVDGHLVKSDTRIGDVIKKANALLSVGDGHLQSASESELPEFRCVCGKLLFKGTLHFSTIEVKCKRCGEITRIDASDRKFLG